MVKVKEFLEICDSLHTVWINNGDDCSLYINSVEALETATAEELNATIEYFTLDGDKKITLEI